MKALERFKQAGPWLLGLTFFILAGLAMQLSTVQLRSVTFVYGARDLLPNQSAAFRVIVYDPLLNRTRDSVSGSWRLSNNNIELTSGSLNGFGEFIIQTETPAGMSDVTLSVNVADSILGQTDVSIPLKVIAPSLRGPTNQPMSSHQAWALHKDGKAILAKLYPLNAFELVRGLSAPVVIELLSEEGNPVPNAQLKLSDCMTMTDQAGKALCPKVFTRSPALKLAVESEGLRFNTEFETSGHSQSLDAVISDDLSTLELKTLPFRDIIHIDHWYGSFLVESRDIPRQRDIYEWVPRWLAGDLPQTIVAYRRILNPNSTATYFSSSEQLRPRPIETHLEDLGYFQKKFGERVIPLLGTNKTQNEARVVNLQTHLKSRVAQLMLLLGVAVIGSMITYGYRAQRRRKERLREWMLESDDDEFDPEIIKLGGINNKVDIVLGFAVLTSFLFGLYVMLTELLRWGWELI